MDFRKKYAILTHFKENIARYSRKLCNSKVIGFLSPPNIYIQHEDIKS